MTEPICSFCNKTFSSKVAVTKHTSTCKEKEKVEHRNELQALRNQYESQIQALQEQIDKLSKQPDPQPDGEGEPGSRMFTEAQVLKLQTKYEKYVNHLEFSIEVYKKVIERVYDFWEGQKDKYQERIKSLEYSLESQKQTCEMLKDALYSAPKSKPVEPTSQPVFNQPNNLPSDA